MAKPFISRMLLMVSLSSFAFLLFPWLCYFLHEFFGNKALQSANEQIGEKLYRCWGFWGIPLASMYSLA